MKFNNFFEIIEEAYIKNELKIDRLKHMKVSSMIQRAKDSDSLKDIFTEKLEDYYNELNNSLIRAETAFTISKAYLDEAKEIYNFTENISKIPEDKYFTLLIYMAEINIMSANTYIHVFLERLSQFLNLYLKFQFDERHLSFNDIITRLQDQNIIQSFKDNKLNYEDLLEICKIKDKEINGISIYPASRNLRNEFEHRLPELNGFKIFESKILFKQFYTIKYMLYETFTIFDSLNKFMLKNGYYQLPIHH